jgi:hypothetical protein
VDWWIGGLVDWWIGGLVDWWIGGLGLGVQIRVDSRHSRINLVSGIFGFFDRQRVGKATTGNICTRWLQARRARSDAPYHQGIAMRHFDLMANF